MARWKRKSFENSINQILIPHQIQKSKKRPRMGTVRATISRLASFVLRFFEFAFYAASFAISLGFMAMAESVNGVLLYLAIMSFIALVWLLSGIFPCFLRSKLSPNKILISEAILVVAVFPPWVWLASSIPSSCYVDYSIIYESDWTISESRQDFCNLLYSIMACAVIAWFFSLLNMCLFFFCTWRAHGKSFGSTKVRFYFGGIFSRPDQEQNMINIVPRSRPEYPAPSCSCSYSCGEKPFTAGISGSPDDNCTHDHNHNHNHHDGPSNISPGFFSVPAPAYTEAFQSPNPDLHHQQHHHHTTNICVVVVDLVVDLVMVVVDLVVDLVKVVVELVVVVVKVVVELVVVVVVSVVVAAAADYSYQRYLFYSCVT